MKNVVKNARIIAILGIGFLSGCTTITRQTEFEEVTAIEGVAVAQPAIERDHGIRDGQAMMVWEEPMVDVVDVPPGLDPEGHYYRPAHKSIVEIRQGRWQYYDRSKK